MTAYYANINPATFVRLSRTNPKMSKNGQNDDKLMNKVAKVAQKSPR
jgi:hypothetical protein